MRLKSRGGALKGAHLLATCSRKSLRQIADPQESGSAQAYPLLSLQHIDYATYEGAALPHSLECKGHVEMLN